MKNYTVGKKILKLEPRRIGFAGYWVWETGTLLGEIFRGAFGRYWWATTTGEAPYHQADDMGAAIEWLAKEGRE